ncbi:MAG: hypothetical protein LASZOEIN_001487 [Candidatus Fervidibacter sp.]
MPTHGQTSLPFHKFVATLFRVKGVASGRIASKGKHLTTASAFGGDNEKRQSDSKKEATEDER